MRRVGLGFVVALALTGFCLPARAADIAPPAQSYYPAAPLPPATYDWSGLYIGGNVGAGLLADTFTPIGTGTAPGAPLGPTKVSPVGVIGGGQAGVNFEWAPWVIGAEVSWDSSAITATKTVADAGGTSESSTSNPQWIATATGRFGWASNDLLFYAKGGGAWMHVSYTQELVAGGISGPVQSISDNRSGFTAGAGLEYAFTENLSGRMEYDFMDFGTKNYSGFTLTPVSVRSNLSTLTAGINYRFNWAGGGPLH
jgi:outer membrane immunogenic protein